MTIKELMKKARKSTDEGNYTEAIFYLLTILEIEEYNLETLLFLGKIYLYLEEVKESLRYIEKAYKYYSDNLEVISLMGLLNEQLGKNKKALIYYEKYLEKRENYDIYANMAVCCQKMGHVKKALGYIEKSIKMDPSRFEAYIMKAKFYEEREMYEETMEIYEKLLKKFKGRFQWEIYMNMGICYYQMENIEKFLECFNISINFKNLPTTLPFEQFYDILAEEGMHEEVELLLINYKNSHFSREESLKMEYRFSRFWIKDYERASKVCNQLVKLNKDNLTYKFWLGENYIKLKDYEKALDTLKNLDGLLRLSMGEKGVTIEKYEMLEHVESLIKNVKGKIRKKKKLEEKK